MFSWKKILGVLLCLVMICSITVGCDDDDDDDDDNGNGNGNGTPTVQTYKIGVVLPLSGVMAGYGKELTKVQQNVN